MLRAIYARDELSLQRQAMLVGKEIKPRLSVETAPLTKENEEKIARMKSEAIRALKERHGG